MRDAHRPILWMSGLILYYGLLIAYGPELVVRARPGGPLISILYDINPFVAGLTGLALGLRFFDVQSRIQRFVTLMLMLITCVIIAMVLVDVMHSYHATPRMRVFGL